MIVTSQELGDLLEKTGQPRIGPQLAVPKRIIEFELPIKLVSEANAREHWRKKAKRSKEQRGIFDVFTSQHLPIKLPVHVTITRYGPGSRKLDFDNLANSAKHAIDGIADALGVDDGDATKVTWEVKQERGPYKVRIEIK